MAERKYLISAVQLFCFVFLYLFSGMMLYAGGSAVAALFAALFCACVCIIAAVICEKYSSAHELYRAIFGKAGLAFRYICILLTAYSLIKTLFAFSGEAASFYSGGAKGAILLSVLLLACFAQARGFAAPARFAEACVFPLAFAVLISCTGGDGEGLSFSFGEELIFTGFDIIGSVPVLFSLYLRCTGWKSEKISEFAKNSAFRPSPLGCGLCAVVASLIFYAFFRLAEGENIMLSFFLWFVSLSRITVHALAICDLAGLPENELPRKKASSLLAAAVGFAAVLLPMRFLGDGMETMSVFINVIFPCAVFVLFVIRHGSAEKTNRQKSFPR